MNGDETVSHIAGMRAVRLGGFRRWVVETRACGAACHEKDAIQSDYTDIALKTARMAVAAIAAIFVALRIWPKKIRHDSLAHRAP